MKGASCSLLLQRLPRIISPARSFVLTRGSALALFFLNSMALYSGVLLIICMNLSIYPNVLDLRVE